MWEKKRIECEVYEVETLKYKINGRNWTGFSDWDEQAIQMEDSEIAEAWFDLAIEY